MEIEPTAFCAANAMLYHWATETHICHVSVANEFSAQHSNIWLVLFVAVRSTLQNSEINI